MAKCRARKGQGHVRLRAHHGPFRRRRDRRFTRTPERCFRRGLPRILADSALCRLSQNNLLRLVIPVPERAVPDIHTRRNDGRESLWTEQHVSGKDRPFLRSDRYQTRTMHTEVDVPNPKYELVPGMYASVKIPLHAAAKVLTVPVQACSGRGRRKGSRPGDRSGKQSGTARRRLGTANGNRRRSHFRPAGKRNWSFSAVSDSTGRGEIVSPKLVEPSRMEGEK